MYGMDAARRAATDGFVAPSDDEDHESCESCGGLEYHYYCGHVIKRGPRQGCLCGRRMPCSCDGHAGPSISQREWDKIIGGQLQLLSDEANDRIAVGNEWWDELDNILDDVYHLEDVYHHCKNVLYTATDAGLFTI